MSRKVSWFSCGAASAIATKLSKPDVISYCETNSEHPDNKRFMRECGKWFVKEITVLRNEKYVDTWDVWEKRQYISGVKGAPCTYELKVKPRLDFQLPGDIHIFGYTADARDVKRANDLRENWPNLNIETPLIDKGITKSACIAMLRTFGILEPITYEMGLPNANCIPCVKATSPNYWSLIRKLFPFEFWRICGLSRRLGAKLTRINGERIFLDQLPADWPVTDPIAPECDFLCSIAEQEIMEYMDA